MDHEAKAERDGGLWRAVCSCGYKSILCRSKAAAGRAADYHLRHEGGDGRLTVSSRRSRLPFRRPTGSMRPAAYASSAEACLDAKDRDAPKKQGRR